MSLLLTVTLDTSPGLPLPAAFRESVYRGIRLTLTAPSGNKASTEIEDKAVWQFEGLLPSTVYKLDAESVDMNDKVIQAMTQIEFTTPVAPVTPGTYTRINGATLSYG